MKRHKVILTILLLFLVAGLIRSQAGGQGVQPGNKAQTSSVKKNWHVVGWGLNEKQAVDHALNRAADQVWDYLRKQDPDFVWKPSPDYVRDHLLGKEWKPLREPGKDYVVPDQDEEKREAWSLTVEITPQAFEKMKRINRELVLTGKQADRLTLAGKIVGLLIAGFVLALTYLRLEEKTKGYYSRLLLFGAVGLLILVGGAILFVL